MSTKNSNKTFSDLSNITLLSLIALFLIATFAVLLYRQVVVPKSQVQAAAGTLKVGVANSGAGCASGEIVMGGGATSTASCGSFASSFSSVTPKFAGLVTTGNVGVGTTSPSTRLHVVNTSEPLRIGYDASNYNSFTVGSTGSLTLAATGTNPSIILTPGGTGYTLLNGNVGIGTTAPSYKLQVVGTVYAGGSSRDYKTNIGPLELDSSKIYKLNPVSYDYKEQYKSLGKILSGGRQFGLIAEDVYSVYPELTLSDGNKKIANVDYEKLSVLLLAQMKNQKKEIDTLKLKVADLEKRLVLLESKLK